MQLAQQWNVEKALEQKRKAEELNKQQDNNM